MCGACSGHCLDVDRITAGCQLQAASAGGDVVCDTLFVFDYSDGSAVDNGNLQFPARNVYDCEQILACDVQAVSSSVYDYGASA